jgi:hypothetical protein
VIYGLILQRQQIFDFIIINKQGILNTMFTNPDRTDTLVHQGKRKRLVDELIKKGIITR